MSLGYPRQLTLRMAMAIIISVKATVTGNFTVGEICATIGGNAMMAEEIRATAVGNVMMDGMTSSTTGAMFVMTTGATIINRRFDRTSKIFAMREMKSNRDARSCAGIIKS